MASVNRRSATKKTAIEVSETKTHTHGGAVTAKIDNAEELLYRTVMACMLWEDTFYEEGKSIASRIQSYIKDTPPNRVAAIAVEARKKLRHVPLFIVREMARIDTHKHLVSNTLYQIIQRPDELAEFLAIYWKEKRQPLSAQVKKGLAIAYTKFDEYALAKYNRGHAIKLRDVLFLCHAKPIGGVKGFTKKARKSLKETQNKHNPFNTIIKIPQDEGSQLFRRLIADELKTPDTWETEMSAKGNNKESWERLINQNKLKDLAILRNLRNMIDKNVDRSLITKAINSITGIRIIPYRYITAAKYAPGYETELENALFRSISYTKKLQGTSIIVVDVSGSMGAPVSKDSEIDRLHAACAMAAIAREQCENAIIYATAGDDRLQKHATTLIPSRRGFALMDAIRQSRSDIGGGGIFLKQAIDFIREKNHGDINRIIVITDEQDCDHSTIRSPDNANPFGKYNYILNVGTYACGIAYGKWTHISGFSEMFLEYVKCFENGYNQEAIDQW